ncbi:MAG: diguanylate cyclase [Syntrophomonadaceae bacterium]|nr:diguanylate cyclase [Syntrophomonadaceae bacterium]
MKMIRFKQGIMIILIFFVVVFSFSSKYDSLIKDFESTAISKEVRLREHVQVSSNLIKGIAITGNILLEQEGSIESELYRYLRYVPVKASYNLDAVVGTQYEKRVGNLTGMGPIPDSGMNKDEINLALQCNKIFNSFYEKFPDVAWLYYTSENGFINMYPWIASKDFSYSDKLKTVPFYTIANPQNNPLRKSVWSPVYLDEAGKGLMITLSEPIYCKDTFKGVISLDLTNAQLSKIITSEYESYLIDDTDTVLANSRHSISDHQVMKISDFLSLSASDIKSMKELKMNTVQRFGGYYIYAAAFNNAPWKIFALVPVWLIARDAAAATIPILLISILFLLSMHQIDKRKISEKLLNREKELMETTLFSINEGIIVTDQAGNITLMNEIAEKFTGWSNEEAYGKQFDTVFHNFNISNRARISNPVKQVLETGKNVNSERTIGLLSRDGSEIYILGSAAGIVSNTGKMTGVVVSFRDITKEYEQEKEIEGFLNVNLDMLCVADAEFNFHKVNKMFEEILGYKTEELEGRSIFDYVHEDDIAATREVCGQLEVRGGVATFTNRYRCKDGAYKYIEWHSQISVGKFNYSSARDVTEKLMMEENLRRIAIRDELTGLYNRHFLDAVIEEHLARSDRYDEPISMALLDLDHFKKVNDTWGHPVGDEMLKLIAQITENIIRSSDVLVRFGGEEFAVLMPQTSLNGAIGASEKIRQAIEVNNHPVTGKQTASFGVAERVKNESFASWYQRVDEALYRAKEAGRNCVVAADQ